jgi:hypothetical protein
MHDIFDFFDFKKLPFFGWLCLMPFDGGSCMVHLSQSLRKQDHLGHAWMTRFVVVFKVFLFLVDSLKVDAHDFVIFIFGLSINGGMRKRWLI